jgi:hypothetical protein
LRDRTLPDQLIERLGAVLQIKGLIRLQQVLCAFRRIGKLLATKS